MQWFCCRTVGWDGDKSWFAHCVQLSDQDIEYFREKGMGVAHCPSSNMRLASGEHSLTHLKRST